MLINLIESVLLVSDAVEVSPIWSAAFSNAD